MLVTPADAERQVDDTYPRGERAWGYFQLDGEHRLIFATCRVREAGEDPWTARIIIHDEEVLLTLIHMTETVEFTQALLLSPPSLNGSAEWKLERLSEIHAPICEKNGRVYVLANGSRYTEPRDAAADNLEVVQYETLFPVYRDHNQLSR